MPVLEVPVAARQSSTRSVAVRRLDKVDAAIDVVADAADRGACACYIRNTVGDAVEAYRELKDRGYDAILFHARFAMCDRLDTEKLVLNLCGKASTPAQRSGRIVVSTQVIEQSLDLDFDVLVTDLCPIDLLIQRAGREWRHEREGRPVEVPVMYVVSPDPIYGADENWYRSMFRAASFVYPSAALLWLSARELFRAGKLVTPDGVRPLVEAVYGATPGNVPRGLREDFDRHTDRAFGQETAADNNLLRVGDGYQPGHRGWAQDVHTPTRLGEPTRGIRLAHWDGVDLTPYAGGVGLSAWLLSEVSIARRKCVTRGSFDDPVLEAAATALEQSWDDGSFVLPVDAAGSGEMSVINMRGIGALSYDAETGLS
jgi:CRISPR-associated endonuclease/helicase Cas3